MAYASPPRRLRRPRGDVIAIGFAALFAAMLVREAWHEATKEHVGSRSIDDRFAPLVAAVRGAPRIGFLGVSVDGHEAFTRRVELQYAVAPTVVASQFDAGRLLAFWSETPDGAKAYAARGGYRILATTDEGFAILERTGP